MRCHRTLITFLSSRLLVTWAVVFTAVLGLYSCDSPPRTNVLQNSGGGIDRVASSGVLAKIADWKSGCTTLQRKGIAISSVEDLRSMDRDLSADYYLSSDIVLEEPWEPLGGVDRPFTGTLRGNCHVLSNLTIEYTSRSYVGLFSTLSQAHIENVAVELVRVHGRSYVGGLAGAAYDSTLSNVAVAGVYKKSNDEHLVAHSSTRAYVGGIVGWYEFREGGTVAGDVDGGRASGRASGHVADLDGYNIAVSVASEGGDYVGGLVGRVIRAEVNGTVSAKIESRGGKYVGGLVGGLAGGSDGNTGLVEGRVAGVVQSLSYGADAFVGGLVGENFGKVVGLSNARVGSESGSRVGGLVGSNSGTVIGSVSGDVHSANGDAVGGLVGYNTGTVEGSASARVQSDGGSKVGGLVGHNIGNVYGESTAEVTSVDGQYLGGLVGISYGGHVEGSASGNISSYTNNWVGGLVGAALGGVVRGYALGWVNIGTDGDTPIGGCAISPSKSIDIVIETYCDVGRGSRIAQSNQIISGRDLHSLHINGVSNANHHNMAQLNARTLDIDEFEGEGDERVVLWSFEENTWPQLIHEHSIIKSLDMLSASRPLYMRAIQVPKPLEKWRSECLSNSILRRPHEDALAIASAEALLAIQENLDGIYYLARDIDISGIDWQSLGYFSGVLYGDCNVINGLSIDRPLLSAVGLFTAIPAIGGTQSEGDAGSAAILDLGISIKKVRGNTKVGAIAGTVSRPIDNVAIAPMDSALQAGTGYHIGGQGISGMPVAVGGLVGVSNADIQGYNFGVHVFAARGFGIGGLVGIAEGVEISGQVDGRVRSNAGFDMGGLVGRLTESTAIGVVNADVVTKDGSNIGGLVGHIPTGEEHSYIYGMMSGNVIQSATGALREQMYVGGIVGNMQERITSLGVFFGGVVIANSNKEGLQAGCIYGNRLGYQDDKALNNQYYRDSSPLSGGIAVKQYAQYAYCLSSTGRRGYDTVGTNSGAEGKGNIHYDDVRVGYIADQSEARGALSGLALLQDYQWGFLDASRLAIIHTKRRLQYELARSQKPQSFVSSGKRPQLEYIDWIEESLPGIHEELHTP